MPVAKEILLTISRSRGTTWHPRDISNKRESEVTNKEWKVKECT